MTERSPVPFLLGDVVRLRRPHPCGGTDWLVDRLGADIGQGYHICRPLTRDLLDDYLAEPAHHHGLLPERATPSLAATHSSP